MQPNTSHHFFRRAHWLCAVIGIILLIGIPAWLAFVVPELKKIPNNFSYSAETLSLDNFFDEKTHKFEGQHISKTTFSYNVVAVKPNYLIIKNLFAVRTLNDKPIISITRFYYIDPLTSQHINVGGEKNRTGYLFGPRYANRDTYTYWHVNYDAPATLKFIDKTKIDNLPVYHYEANYQADQTADLSYLPGVPQQRGVKVNVHLQVWIEPISGWLVKYQDNSLAYFYNRHTGAQLGYWNQFSNQYTQSSIHNQVYAARILKWKILTIDFIVPSILFLLAVSMLLRCFWQPSQRVKQLVSPIKIFSNKIRPWALPSLALVLFVGIMGFSAYYFIYSQQQTPVYTIGISQWNNNADLLETIEGFKDGLAAYSFHDGQNIKFITINPKANIQNQIDVIQELIRNKADLIFTLTTPGTYVAKGITNITPIVFSDVSYPVEDEIIYSLDSSQNNLVGTRNYIPPAIQFNAFEKIYPNIKTLGFVHHQGDPDSEIQFQEYKSLLSQRNIKIIDIAAIDLDDLQKQLQQTNHVDVLYSACDTLMQEGGGQAVADFGLKNKIPSFSCYKETTRQGALMGYVADPYANGKLAGKKAALILLGADPSWLITESPNQGYFIINLQTAKKLGIPISKEIISKTNELIR